MIELRWVWRDVEINEDVGYKERFLQYRKNGVSCIDEFAWQDVPEVTE